MSYNANMLAWSGQNKGMGGGEGQRRRAQTGEKIKMRGNEGTE
jgi:hypothetical protein